MYAIILTIHSLVRWLVLVSIIYAIYRACKGWKTNRTFSRADNLIRHTTATIAHIQLLLGICLYCISPLVQYFLHSYKEAKHNRGIRFFGMEHSTMMLLAVVVITIGSAYAKRRATDKLKFKTMAIWYSIALLIILLMIPWPFSPLASRPYMR
ncbi:MAG: hypothetical protein J0I41_19435 [Filimonas sp.]|nr:hypothetical protein [Filimonas sp.]